ncbi:acylneuraminate cytidylyltransferase family protein [Hoeflea sp. WL0058]|uniref:Acylneuraminate cytidylyltransferase family protein n=1 Tax=Flavimaribacter sediminis TaxID=2865987 RepID=A0AAE2ZKD9_9HYPH|nr:acylneuraminate cytidylyltransferase family protein [Flavimaribacter sediminis]
MSRVAVICARGGSKGVPGKNLRLLGGKPLITRTVDQAKESGLFDCVAVSSDAAEILQAAKVAGADLLVERPSELASDLISVHPAIAHCIAAVEPRLKTAVDSFTYLQVTSPFRIVQDISDAIALWEAYRPGSVVSATPSHSSPYFSLVEEQEDGTVALSKPTEPLLTRRQDAPRCWDLNGAVYVFDHARYKQDPRVLYQDTRIAEMPPERSLDIDTEFDWRVAEMLWNSNKSI